MFYRRSSGAEAAGHPDDFELYGNETIHAIKSWFMIIYYLFRKSKSVKIRADDDELVPQAYIIYRGVTVDTRLNTTTETIRLCTNKSLEKTIIDFGVIIAGGLLRSVVLIVYSTDRIVLGVIARRTLLDFLTNER